MATKRGDDTSGADQDQHASITHLGAHRAERDEQNLKRVVERIHEEFVRQGVGALTLPVDPLAGVAGSLERLRKAARRAGARYGWAKTRTTKVGDDGGVERLVVYEAGRDLRLVGGMDPRLRRVVERLPAPGKFSR